MDPNRVLLPNLDPNPTPRLNAKASSFVGDSFSLWRSWSPSASVPAVIIQPALNAKASSYMASKDFQESKVHDPSMVNCDLVSMGDLLKRIDDRAFPGDFEILQG